MGSRDPVWSSRKNNLEGAGKGGPLCTQDPTSAFSMSGLNLTTPLYKEGAFFFPFYICGNRFSQSQGVTQTHFSLIWPPHPSSPVSHTLISYLPPSTSPMELLLVPLSNHPPGLLSSFLCCPSCLELPSPLLMAMQTPTHFLRHNLSSASLGGSSLTASSMVAHILLLRNMRHCNNPAADF